jgi:predicted nuclease of predicted toxin-antitoxin system
MFKSEFAHILQSKGHDVLRACEAGKARADDAEILSNCISEKRILITLDEHFGDWAILPLNLHYGVIRIKMHPPVTHKLSNRLIEFLINRKQNEFENKLIILYEKRERWIDTSGKYKRHY